MAPGSSLAAELIRKMSLVPLVENNDLPPNRSSIFFSLRISLRAAERYRHKISCQVTFKYYFLSLLCLFFLGHLKFRYISSADAPDGAESAKVVDFKWPDGDKTLVSIDMSSLNPETVGHETMSLFKYLIILEKQKRVTSYDISYTECKRRASSGADGFEVALKNPSNFKTICDTSKALTCKSFFHESTNKVDGSKLIQTVFRFRFDRVHACTKVQRPYVYSILPIELDAMKPLELA